MIEYKGKKYITHTELHEKAMKDPEYRRGYEALKPRYEFISQLIDLRNQKKITQKQLAKMLKTRQPSIARFESGRNNPSLDFAA
ncbi:MAG: helix-turn-helix transcriptional regulator, partial [Patescibacteria group bacterium]|nr:helix-turn-helix transcriptional regulator [Patescibacteria group bacterium]